jgi:hypothetical protein
VKGNFLRRGTYIWAAVSKVAPVNAAQELYVREMCQWFGLGLSTLYCRLGWCSLNGFRLSEYLS